MGKIWYPLAKEIISHIVKLNGEKVDLGEVAMYVDFVHKKVEFTSPDTETTLEKGYFFGTLDQLDYERLLVASDAESAFVIDCMAHILDQALELANEEDQKIIEAEVEALETGNAGDGK